MAANDGPVADEFGRAPHRTMWRLSLPVMASLVVEPVAGLVDTAFVERLGSAQAAALGAATALLSSAIWVFNFLGVATQTEVARAHGAADREGAGEVASLSLSLALGIGLAVGLLALPWLDSAARFMGGDAAVQHEATTYLRLRLLGLPAMLGTLSIFGALRGLQQMKVPLRVATVMSAGNLVLDPLLIFGPGPLPALGIGGAAWATVASQWLGLGLGLHALRGQLPLATPRSAARLRTLLVVGRDMVVRTGSLLLLLLLATRAALEGGAETGAAHQALRQVWMLLAFLLDAYAASAQSLIGQAIGAGAAAGAVGKRARRVATVASTWAFATGVLVSLLLLLGQDALGWLLVPASARGHFDAAFLPCALSQPICALSFVTDGIHFGSGEYTFLRNAMLLSTAAGIAGLWALHGLDLDLLAGVWWVTAGWVALRAGFGALRLWPGFGPVWGRRAR